MSRDTEEIQKIILSRWNEAEKRSNELEAKTYDGIFGKPPEWVIERVLTEFRKHRDRVLFDWGYNHDMAILWLDRFSNIGSDENDDWDYPAEYPCGEKLGIEPFIESMSYLSYLKWCVSLGPEEGLKKLSGETTSLGYKRKQQNRDFANKNAIQVHEEREKEWDRWQREAESIVKRYPHLKGKRKKSDIARIVIKNLNLRDTVQTVRKRIKHNW
ncbi:MAG: hypothetical protein AB2826_27440 [Candidatus Thiodiazotropha sp.]